MKQELYLKAAFCCMACDGEIADEEIKLIKSYIESSTLFYNLDVESLLNDYILSINTKGKLFLNSFLDELKKEEKTEEEELEIVSIAINMIEADNEIAYSEIKFFKRIRKCLSITDDILYEKFPDKEDFFLPDMEEDDFDFLLATELPDININLQDISSKE